MINDDTEHLNIKKLQSGDQEEITKMAQLYSDSVYRVALRMLSSSTEAEDVLQETFIKAIKSIGSFEGRSSLSTWLYRIAVNEALMVIRKRKPEVALVNDENDEEDNGISVSQIVDWCCLPESEFLSNETREILDQAIHKLPENLRTVFILRDVEGLSILETAEALNLTETNVKTRLLRARMRLREELSAYFGEKLVEK